MAETTIKDFIDIPALENTTSRMIFLLNRIEKYAKELESLGITVSIDCTANDTMPNFLINE